MKKKTRKKINLILISTLVFLNVIPVMGWTPEHQKALFSDIEWNISFRIGYGSLVDEPIFIPFDKQIVPTPEIKVIMGGVERFGSRNVTFILYNYNTTSHKYDDWYKNATFIIILGSNDRYGIEDITLPADANATKMRVEFCYLDILVSFYYEPDPLYIHRNRTELDIRWRGVIMVFFAIVAFIAAQITGRRVQRRSIIVPKMPILEGVFLILGSVLFISAIVVMRFAYEGFDIIIRGFLAYDWFFIYLPMYGVFSLWVAYRHTGDILKELHIDLSRFDWLERNSPEITSTENKKEEDKASSDRTYRWTKDMAIYSCYWHKKQLCWIRNPNEWKGFVQRLLGHHETISEEYIQSIRPDEAYWCSNDDRVFISAVRITDQPGEFGFDTENLHWDDFFMSGLALVLFLLGSFVLKGWPSIALMGLGVTIFIIGFITKRSVLQVKRVRPELKIDPNTYIEGEMILHQQTNLKKFKDIIKSLQKRLVDKEREAIDAGYDWVIMYVEVFEELLQGVNVKSVESKEDPSKDETAHPT